MYLTVDQIQNLHIEPTSRCNLACPKCARTRHGKVSPDLPLDDLAWSDGFDQSITEKLAKQLKLVMYCGNYGDPAASPNIRKFLEELLSRGVKSQVLYTNGSLRSADWWRQVSMQLKGRGTIVFSIDGLKDSNSIYRVNSNWEKIEENLYAAVDGGCDVRWDFLVFNHNQHDLDDAISLAKKIGVKEFNIKRSARYFLSDLKNKREALEDLSPDEGVSHWKEPLATQPDLKDPERFFEYAMTTKITCKTKHTDPSLYIDFLGRVWPCCWFPAAQFADGYDNTKSQLNAALARYEPDFNSIIKHHIGNILAHRFFSLDLEEMWQPDDKRYFVCGRTCGECFEFTSTVGYKNSRLVSLNEVKS